jgi:hypothetical protein
MLQRTKKKKKTKKEKEEKKGETKGTFAFVSLPIPLTDSGPSNYNNNSIGKTVFFY